MGKGTASLGSLLGIIAVVGIASDRYLPNESIFWTSVIAVALGTIWLCNKQVGLVGAIAMLVRKKGLVALFCLLAAFPLSRPYLQGKIPLEGFGISLFVGVVFFLACWEVFGKAFSTKDEGQRGQRPKSDQRGRSE